MTENAVLRIRRTVQILVVFGFPLLGILYFYQFINADADRVVPFRVFKAPQVLVQDASGRQVDLEFKEPITVVNFWATWCPPCVEEFPAMIELMRQTEGRGVAFMFVSVDDTWDVVPSFLAANRISVSESQVFLDSGKKAAALWGSDKFPETYVVRRDGWVVEKIIGAQQWTRPTVVEYFLGLADKLRTLDPSGKSH